MKLFTLAEDLKTVPHKLCLESLTRHNPDAIIFTKEKIADEVVGGREFVNKYNHISNLHFSDLFRVWYCYNFGGYWIDADTIHLRPITPPDISNDKLVIHYADSNRNQITNHVMYAYKPHLPFLKILLDRQYKLIEDKGPEGLSYLDLGEWSINFIRTNKEHNDLLEILPHWEHHYIPWYNKEYFFQERSWGNFQFDRGLYNPNAFCYHLTNAVIARIAYCSRTEIMSSYSFVSFLFNRALTNGFTDSKDLAILRRLESLKEKYKYLEIGVYKGYNTAIIGQQRNNAFIYGVDPWADISSPEYKATRDYIAFENDNVHEANYQEALAHNWFLLSQGRIELHRKSAKQAIDIFDDNSLDMVFLDGDHSRQAVSEEMNLYWHKVKPNGYLAGHDYNHPNFLSGVKDAVDSFAIENKLSIELDCDYTWFIRK